jgi:ABC-2 type transport system ATP-binding protein
MTRQSGYVHVENLTKVYPATTGPAVDAISMSLQPGEIVAFLGPNGAGKTTTVKMIAGLIMPTSGQVHVLGHDVTRERTAAVRHMGAVLEGARNLYWRLPAWENLLYFGALRAVPSPLLKQRANGLLTLLDLYERKDQEVRHFSRGMQQKLAIVAAMLHDPEVLLLDEPTLGLDLQAARKVEETILYLAREQGKAILLTTHTMPLAEKVADRIFVIQRGRQVVYDTTQRLLDRYNGQREAIEITVDGLLPELLLTEMVKGFPDLSPMVGSDKTVLCWPTPSQPEVIQLLQFLDSQGVTILQVRRRQATLEELFLAWTETAPT